MINALIITAYLFIVLPLIIGACITLLAKHRKRFSFLYVSGYTVYLALIEILMIFQGSQDTSYIHLINNWKILTLVISVFSILLMIAGLVVARKRQCFKAILPNGITRTDLITVFFTIILVLFSILLLVPCSQDQTPELARLTLNSNCLFSIDPNTGMEYTDPSAYPGCLFLLYALGSTLTGIDVTTLIHLFMPIVFIPFFVCCYSQIAYILFPADEQRKDRPHFVWLIMLFYLMMIPFETHLAFAPYRNIWNGITLASSCLLPLLFCICIDIIRYFGIHSIKAKPVFSIMELIIMIIISSLSTMLCIRFGLIIDGLLVLAIIGAGLIMRFIQTHSVKKEGDQL